MRLDATIAAADLDWRAAHGETPGSRYLTTIIIAWCPLHLEARQLTDPDYIDDAGYGTVEERAFTEWPEDMDALNTLCAEADFVTVTAEQLGIDDPAASGRYLLFAVPHSN